MPKIPLVDVGSLGNPSSARQNINNNKDEIQAAFDDMLDRKGRGPNQMEAELDMNSYKLLNVGDPVDDMDAVNKRSIGALVSEFAAQIVETAVLGQIVVDPFTAAAGQTSFALSQPPGGINNVELYLDGVAQRPSDDYTLSGPTLQTLTLLVPAVLNQKVMIRYARALPAGSASADAVTYTDSQGSAGTVESYLDGFAPVTGGSKIGFAQAGTGARARDVLTKLREVSVSVKDFGAIADGTVHPLSERYATLAEAQAVYPHATALTDTIDWAAAQAAVTYVGNLSTSGARGGWVEFTPGSYVINQLILIESNKVVNVRGHGEGSEIRRSNSGTIFEIKQNITIKDLFLTGPMAGTSNGIYMNAANVARVENIIFQNQVTGIQLHDTFAAEIVGCIFNVCFSYGVYADTGAHNTVLERNNFFSCGVANNGQAIAFAVNSDNLIIDNNDFEFCNVNLLLQDCRSVSIKNNYMEYHSTAWALFGGTCTGIVVESNWIALGSGGGATALLENIVGGRFIHNTIYNQSVNFSTTTLEGFSVGLNRKLGTGTLAKAPWITPSLTNGWAQQTNYSAVGYLKDEFGWVHLRGGLISGTAGNACFTLPASYRPPTTVVFGTASANGACRISITTAGVVTPDVAASNNAGLDGIQFYVGD